MLLLIRHTETHCNTLQHTAIHFKTLQHILHCNTLQHTATYCNTLQHTVRETWYPVRRMSFMRALLCCSSIQCVAVCCSVCCSVLQCVETWNPARRVSLMRALMCCSVLQRVAACCSVLQCVAVCRSVLRPGSRRSGCRWWDTLQHTTPPATHAETHCSTLRQIPLVDQSTSVLQRAAVCCSLLQRVAAYCTVLQCVCSVLRPGSRRGGCRWWAHSCFAVCCSVLQRIAVCCSVFETWNSARRVSLMRARRLKERSVAFLCVWLCHTCRLKKQILMNNNFF